MIFYVGYVADREPKLFSKKGFVILFQKRLQFCLDLLKGSYKYYISALIVMECAIISDLISPLFYSFIVDDVLRNEPSEIPPILREFALSFGDRVWYLENLWFLGVCIIIISLISGVFIYARSYLTAKASENIAKILRDRLYDSVQRWSYQSHVMAETGDLLQRCSTDVETARRFLSGQIIEVCRAISLISISLFVLVPINSKLSLISLVIMPLIGGFCYYFFGKVMEYFTASDECEGKLSARLQETLTGVRVVRAFGRQRYELDRFADKNGEYRKLSQIAMVNDANFWSVSDLLCSLQIILSGGAATYFVIIGELSVGSFLIFLLYIHNMVWPIRSLGRIISDFGKAVVSLDRIGEVLNADQEDYEDEKLYPDLQQDIVFENVHFAYKEDDPILSGVSFTIPAGKTVALLGSTASGKSSLLLLLQRLYEVNDGRITIGGIDIRDISKKHLREHIGIVLQEPFLFSRSIKDNIGITKKDASEEMIKEAARIAVADGFIADFEEGYETIVGERGVTLSGGQKQRVAIARTLLRDSDILVFDDSLSAVDTETDAAIRRELKTNKKGQTTFLVSHRLTTLQEADIILVLEKGKITQEGTHQELIAKEGLYQKIYQIQSYLENELVGEMEVE